MQVEIANDDIFKKGISSVLEFYDCLAIAKQQFNSAVAFITGVNSPFLNVLFDFRLDKSNSTELIVRSHDFFSEYKIPWAWFMLPPFGKHDLVQNSFSLIEEAPGMYFNLTENIPKISSDYIEIREVAENLEQWIQPINEGYEVEEGDDGYRRLNETLLKKEEKRLKHFVAYYENNVAAAGTLFLSREGDAVMLHNLATRLQFQNKGIATNLTLYMMSLAKKMGYSHCYLDSSEVAFALYKKIGFKVYYKTKIFMPNS